MWCDLRLNSSATLLYIVPHFFARGFGKFLFFFLARSEAFAGYDRVVIFFPLREANRLRGIAAYLHIQLGDLEAAGWRW
jgi:hypothetical protein